MSAKFSVSAGGVDVGIESDGTIEGSDVFQLWERLYDRVLTERAKESTPSAGTGFVLERGESIFNDKPNEGEGFL